MVVVDGRNLALIVWHGLGFGWQENWCMLSVQKKIERESEREREGDDLLYPSIFPSFHPVPFCHPSYCPLSMSKCPSPLEHQAETTSRGRVRFGWTVVDILLWGLDGQMHYCRRPRLYLVGLEGGGVGQELAQVEDLEALWRSGPLFCPLLGPGAKDLGLDGLDGLGRGKCEGGTGAGDEEEGE